MLLLFTDGKSCIALVYRVLHHHKGTKARRSQSILFPPSCLRALVVNEESALPEGQDRTLSRGRQRAVYDEKFFNTSGRKTGGTMVSCVESLLVF